MDTSERALPTILPFPSLAAMRTSHSTLLQAHRVQSDVDGIVTTIKAFLQQGKVTGALLDDEEERAVAQSLLDYWSTILYRTGQPDSDVLLEDFDPALAPELPDELCPYKGLDAFYESDRDIFFGRQRLGETLIEKVKDGRLLAVVGPSGSGKSSLVLAGLIPALKRGNIPATANDVPNSKEWRYTPRMVPGSDPLANLVRLLHTVATSEGLSLPSELATWTQEQVQRLREDPDHLVTLAVATSPAPTVVVVDQFEELFTLCTDPAIREAFVGNLLGLVYTSAPPHRVILTMRSDFEPQIARLPAFQQLFEQTVVRVTPLSATELRQAIEQPAEMIGLKFESGLVDQLLQDVLGEPAALPLLQFTLLKLWENREHNRITWDAYSRLGGGRLALAHSADEVYVSLIPEEQVTARRIFLLLVRPSEGLEVTSNRVRLVTLYARGEARDRVERVLQKLIQARLLRVSEGDVSVDIQVEVAHEALIRNWPRLVDWLEAEREYLRQRLRLTQAAEQWQRLERSLDAVLRGALLEEAQRHTDLNELEREFVVASEAQGKQEYNAEIVRQAELLQIQNEAKRIAAQSQRKSRTIRRLVLLLLFLLLFPLILGIQAWRNYLSHWQPVANFPSDIVTALAFAPPSQGHRETFCAGTINIGVGCSSDGTSWNFYQQGLPTGEPVQGGVERFAGNIRGIGALAIDSMNAQHIFAFVLDGRIYKSNNGGVAWQPTNLQLPDSALVRAIAVRNNLALVADTNLELHATQTDGNTWQSISKPGQQSFNGIYDVHIKSDQEAIYIASETGLWQWSPKQLSATQKVADLQSLRFIDGISDKDGLYLLTFDQIQQQTTIYHWSRVDLVTKLAVIDQEPRSLTTEPDSSSEIAVYILMVNGEVWTVTHDGNTQSLGKRPGWFFYIPNELFSRANDLIAVPASTNGNSQLFMSHSHGLLEYRP